VHPLAKDVISQMDARRVRRATAERGGSLGRSGQGLRAAGGGRRPAWSDAIIICPWTIYLCYGDRSILENSYEAMGRFLDFIARELVRDIERRGFHLATGLVGTPYILDVLEANGFLEIAYRLLEQETFPSWLFPVTNGATTIWERWDGWTPEKGFQDKGMNSFNHYAYGAVGAWMYRSVAGLELKAEDPGYRHIIFRPRPGGSITSAHAELKTPQGPTGISWRIEGTNLVVEAFVPAGARATFSPPPGYVSQAAEWGPGQHLIVLTKAALSISD